MMRKKLLPLSLVVLLLITLGLTTACSPADTGTTEAPESPATEQPATPAPPSLAGHYVGYSWRGEADGGSFEESDQYVETILELDDDGIITDATMRFFVLMDGYWTTRQSGNAYLKADFSVEPVAAVPGDDYKRGTSMFTVYTADMMSFYAVAADDNGTVIVGMVDPVTRYLYESKFEADFDFSMPVGDVTIGSGLLIPTVRTSSGGLMKPASWDELADKNFFNIDIWSHVVNDMGILAEIDESSSIQEFLEAMGVEFADGVPQSKDASYGYFGLGGWAGNYDAIAQNLIGQDATQMTSLVDWSVSRYAGAVNDDNIFGVDVESGATRTVQNSIDGISGATVRISRESTSFQRALVDAGILSEDEVIIGRF